ncbi:MAG TPA: DNA-3-methyladenine glycosylase I [Syntrophales bacterium]|nr:DNA-3-methyladenine glycosylase I [Syntrophales bacterium]
MGARRSEQHEDMNRCRWARSDLLIEYHDREWGLPIHDDRVLFEFLVLEGMQAGLSWETVLKKRPSYRLAFDHFGPARIASYGKPKITELLANPNIIRNRLKIEAAIGNAKAFLAVEKEFGSFDRFVWRFVGGRPKQNRWRRLKDIPAETSESDALSKELRRYGFKFVGPTISYAFMQAVGMVNDHLIDCFRYDEVASLADRK